MKGISICVLTYNSLFYNRLAVDKIREFTRAVNYEILIYDNGSTDGSVEWLQEQPDVILYCGSGNSMKHGDGLDFLVRRANYPVVCTLCSDAFPVSPEWLTPAMHLSDEVYLAGIHRGARKKLCQYVCPSYLFGWTEWVKRHSFKDNWPKWDTGQKLAYDCLQQGKQTKFWYQNMVKLGSFGEKACDYNGWVWHTWWSTRVRTGMDKIQGEIEVDYNTFVENHLREKYGLDY